MTNRDIKGHGRAFLLRDVHMAFALLTRLPLPPVPFEPDAPRPAAHGAWAYPLVGLAVGAIVVLTALVLSTLGAPPAVAAGSALLAGLLSTGAMHEDGLADCADGFWGGWTRERRLEIMKDSQIGTYGVLALGLVVGLRWALFAHLIADGAFIAAVLSAAVTSRAVMVWVMHSLSHARESGLSLQTGQPHRQAVITALGIGVCVTGVGVGHAVFLVAAIAGLVALGVMRLARAKIGGQTGDVLGGTQQIVELAVLLGISLTL